MAGSSKVPHTSLVGIIDTTVVSTFSQPAFDIRKDPKTCAYIPLGDESPYANFDRAIGYLGIVRKKAKEQCQGGVKIGSETILAHLPIVIFGSNHIERVGLGIEETAKICDKVFRAESINLEAVPEGFIQYYREVVQHALALQYITTEMVSQEKPLSEGMILKTHRIPTEKIDTPGGTSWENYSEKYRHVPVHAGSTNFVAPRFVRQKVQELIQDFNNEISEAESIKVLDPFALAAKYCNDFVMKHPFLDGNGRMCRLILNAILLKYAGIAVCIGETDEGRAQHIDIQKRAGERMEGSGELASLVLKKATARYRTLKQKLTGKKRN